jgi:hypothetical protein
MATLSSFFGGLDDTVWTDARAAKLDNADTTVSSRATQTSVNTIDTNVDTINSRVDTTVSSRATQTSVNTIDANVDTINSRVDTTVSSRAPASTALSNSVWTNTRAGYLDSLAGGISASPSSPTGINSVHTFTGSTSLVDVVNITDSGYLNYFVTARQSFGNVATQYQLIIDGVTLVNVTTPTSQDSYVQHVFPKISGVLPGVSGASNADSFAQHIVNYLTTGQLRFNSSLRIRHRLTSGSQYSVAICGYTLD